MPDDMESTRRFEPAATPALMHEVTQAQKRFEALLERHTDGRVAAMCELLAAARDMLASAHPYPGAAIRDAAVMLREPLGDTGA
jgi:hypothetical protein